MSQNGHAGQSALNGSPPATWSQGFLFHGIRVLVLVVIAGVIAGLFPPTGGGELEQYELGMILEEDVIAAVPFSVRKSPDELRRERDAAAGSVPPTFDYQPQAIDTMTARLSRFFDNLDQVAESGDPEEVRRFLATTTIFVDSAQAVAVVPAENRALLRSAAIRSTRELLRQGVLDATQAQALTADRVLIQEPAQPDPRMEDEANVLTPRDFWDASLERLDSPSLNLAAVLRLIMIRHNEFSLVLNVFATETDRDAARATVPEIKETVPERVAVARGNERLTQRDLERLNAYQAELASRGMLDDGGIPFGPLSGTVLLNLLLLALYGTVLFFFRPKVYGNLRWILLQAGLVLTYFAVARVIASNSFPGELLPVAFVTLAVAVLWDSRMSMILGLVLGAITFSLAPFRTPEILYTTLVGGAAAALSVRAVRRRAQTWVFIAIITMAYAGVLLAVSLLQGGSVAELGMAIVWAGSNAAVSGMIAMGFVPVFEWFTGITTDQTLLEWADPNRALLRRLSLEAPGSYAHTINVANLGELAANSIGANGLLCRVGLYYHDVGKVLKPHYFVENQPEGRNPHDKLKPHVSAAIVKEHVVEGARLAREESLPGVIADFVTEHHGTQLIGYFYDKAKEEEGEEEIDEADFRYPGPKPQSKETAIAMMADSIESATRVLQDPTAERLRNLVEGIVDGKMQDGQFDESPLTLQEVAALKDAFVKVLSGIYHHRIDYPTTKHLTVAPETETGENGSDPEEGGAEEEDGPGIEAERAAKEEAQHRMDLESAVEDRVP